jgi:hypothetical protein
LSQYSPLRETDRIALFALASAGGVPGRATGYLLAGQQRSYDSRAILGVA